MSRCSLTKQLIKVRDRPPSSGNNTPKPTFNVIVNKPAPNQEIYDKVPV